MRIIDIVLIVSIISGAVYIIYRSLWKKQGHCPGCDVGTCTVRGINKRSDCH